MQLEFLKNKLESFIPDRLKILGQLYEFYIAGGAITSLVTNSEINDLDIYVKNKLDIVPLISGLNREARILSVTEKSILYRMDFGQDTRLINLILIDSYDIPEEIFNHFDFTCVMGAYNIKTEKFTFSEDFFIDNSMRVLRYNPKTKFPLMSCLRVKKYENKGFRITKNEMTKILLSVCNLNLNSYEDLAKQIGGLYGFNIEDLLDVNVPFDMNNVIEKFTEITGDFDLIASDREYDSNVLTKRSEVLMLEILKQLKEEGYNSYKNTFNNQKCISVNGELITCKADSILLNFMDSLQENTDEIVLYKVVKERIKGIYEFNYINHIISESKNLHCDTSENKIVLNARNEIFSSDRHDTILKLKMKIDDVHTERFSLGFLTKNAKVIDIFKISNKVDKPVKKKIKNNYGIGIAGTFNSLSNTMSVIKQTTKLPF